MIRCKCRATTSCRHTKPGSVRRKEGAQKRIRWARAPRIRDSYLVKLTELTSVRVKDVVIVRRKGLKSGAADQGSDVIQAAAIKPHIPDEVRGDEYPTWPTCSKFAQILD